MSWLWPLALLVLFEILADIFGKQYSLAPNVRLWVYSIGSYVIANIFWLMALSRGAELARGAVLFSVLSAALAIAVGVGFYHEQLSPTRVVGIVLGLIAVVLLVWE